MYVAEGNLDSTHMQLGTPLTTEQAAIKNCQHLNAKPERTVLKLSIKVAGSNQAAPY